MLSNLEEFLANCNKTFGEIFQELLERAEDREGKSISLEKLGQRTQYSKSMVERWLKSEAIPSDIAVLEKLRIALNCTEQEYALMVRAFACDAIIKELRKKGFLPDDEQ
ncbi:MAG: helix-turn-helix transcriptional regulator [Anaerolineae bacterium]|nr:helix-turn-helix transcriptional regulator [Anaerolineae bacterium]